MTRALLRYPLSLSLLIGLGGCEMLGLGGSDDAGAGAKSADAGTKPAAAGVDINALVDKLAAGDEAALEELKKAGKDGGHQLNQLLTSDDVKKRKAAAFAARAFPGEQHSTALAPVLDKEPDAEVAKTLVKTLELSGDPKAVAALVGAVGKKEVQGDVIAALGNLKDKLGDQQGAAVTALVKVASEGPDKQGAIATLGALKDPKAVPGLAAIAKDAKGDEAVRVAALKALGQIGDKDAIKAAIVPALKDKKSEEVRLAAVEAAAEIGHKSALPVIKATAKKDKSKKVKAAAKAASSKLKK